MKSPGDASLLVKACHLLSDCSPLPSGNLLSRNSVNDQCQPNFFKFLESTIFLQKLMTFELT